MTCTFNPSQSSTMLRKARTRDSMGGGATWGLPSICLRCWGSIPKVRWSLCIIRRCALTHFPIGNHWPVTLKPKCARRIRQRSNNTRAIGVLTHPPQPKPSGQPDRPESQKSHLNQEGAQVESAYKTAKYKRCCGKLVTRIDRSISANSSGLNQGKPTNIQHRSKNPADAQQVRVGSHCIEEIRHERAPGNTPDRRPLRSVGLIF